MLTYVILRVLHVGAAAVWLGLPLGTPGAVKRALQKGVDEARAAVHEARRRGIIASFSGVVTLLTGLAIIFHQGGFAAAHRNVHTSLGLVVLMLVNAFVVIRRTGDQLERLVAAGDFTWPSGQAAALVKRLNIFGGVQQLLWVVVLTLMFWR